MEGQIDQRDEDLLWSKILADENKQRVITKLKAGRRDKERWPQESLRQAAVLVPMVTVEGTPSVLFTVRSHHVSRHRNEVSFPGGLADLGDGSPVGTALREAEEELGIPSQEVEVWGQLNSLPDRPGRRTSMIVPVLGFIRNFTHSSLRLSQAEVKSAFTLPVRHLASPKNCRYTRSRSVSFRFPVFLGGSKKIWGVTGFVLDMTLMNLLPRKLYTPISVSR